MKHLYTHTHLKFVNFVFFHFGVFYVDGSMCNLGVLVVVLRWILCLTIAIFELSYCSDNFEVTFGGSMSTWSFF